MGTVRNPGQTAICLLVALLLLVAGCTPGPASRVIPEGASFQIERHKSGLCSFDTRTAVLRVDPEGVVAWEVYTPFSWSNRLQRRDGIGVLEVDNGAVAFDWETGRPLWQVNDASNWRAILESRTVTLINPSRRRVVGLDWESGSPVWSVETGAGVAYGGDTNGDLVFLNVNGLVMAVRADSSDIAWERALPGDASFSPRFQDGVLLHPVFRGILYRLDPDTGSTIWQWDTPDRTIALTDTIEVAGDVVLVTTQGWHGPTGDRDPELDAYRLVALDLGSGSMLWSRVLTEEGVGIHAIHEPATLVHVADRVAVLHRPMVDRLEAVSIDTGKTLWEYDLPHDRVFGADSSEGVLFVGLGRGGGGETSVHAIRLDDGSGRWTYAAGLGSRLQVKGIGDSVLAYLTRTVDSG